MVKSRRWNWDVKGNQKVAVVRTVSVSGHLCHYQHALRWMRPAPGVPFSAYADVLSRRPPAGNADAEALKKLSSHLLGRRSRVHELIWFFKESCRKRVL